MLTPRTLKDDTVFNKPHIHTALKQLQLGIDIELTNHCNAHCYYCPRDLVTHTGFMSEATFKNLVDQAASHQSPFLLFACGHGESILHPDIGDFIAYARNKNLSFGLQTNGSLLTPERRKALIKSGLTTLRFSVSALGELHEQMYRLKFEPILKNIKAFIREANGSCRVGVYIVQTDLNKSLIKDYKTFWEDIGVDHCDVFPVNNRSGSISSKNIIYTDSENRYQVEKIISEESFSNLCTTALVSCFVGYDGNYYLCANDWEKKISIGHVTKLSLREVLIAKKNILGARAASICETCDLNINNRINDCLRLDDKKEALENLIKIRHHEETIMHELLSENK